MIAKIFELNINYPLIKSADVPENISLVFHPLA